MVSESELSKIKYKYTQLSIYLNEKSRRLWAATEATSLGWGGIGIVSNATGLSYPTIRKGIKELKNSDTIPDRLRKQGGGRKPIVEKNKQVVMILDKLIAPYTKGDPESPLRWTSKSTYKLSEALNEKNCKVSPRSVGRILKSQGYSLQCNRKEYEGGNHQDRDSQFEFINDKMKRFISEGKAAISVDTKKKENIGNYKNKGEEYHKHGQAPKVKVYDFIDKKLGKVSPYGVYDIGLNKGWVSVGISSDTAQFAVNTIRCWWHQTGSASYGQTREILITADCGGSNGNRVRLWKVELQKLSNELNLTVHVSHLPPGTSKWNKIEHRMFSYISKNWRGKPLISRETVVQLISNTTTTTGLKIQAVLDENQYEKGIVISDKQLAKVNISTETFHGDWNYCIEPN
jgi:transposase